MKQQHRTMFITYAEGKYKTTIAQNMNLNLSHTIYTKMNHN